MAAARLRDGARVFVRVLGREHGVCPGRSPSVRPAAPRASGPRAGLGALDSCAELLMGKVTNPAVLSIAARKQD